LFLYFFFYKLIKVKEKYHLQENDKNSNQNESESQKKKKILFFRERGHPVQIMNIEGELSELKTISFFTDEDLPKSLTLEDIEEYDVLIFFGRSSLWKKELFKDKKKILLLYGRESRNIDIENTDTQFVWEIDRSYTDISLFFPSILERFDS
jgi:hypothetical protein